VNKGAHENWTNKKKKRESFTKGRKNMGGIDNAPVFRGLRVWKMASSTAAVGQKGG